jgi:hypothetical protein
MRFLINLLRNLALVIVVGVILYLWKPNVVANVFFDYVGYFGPLLALLIVVFALPLRKREK